jgi:3-oxoacyl-[acyl-carrier protein] reductase
MPTDFENQVALVTGGGTGIGRSTAMLFAEHGADVIVNFSRSRDEANEVAAKIQGLGRNAMAIQADVSDDQAVRQMFARAAEEFGRLDILVNNAGMTHSVPATDLEQLTEEKWDEVFAVNVKGTFFCSRAAVELMRKSTEVSGQIINVSSIAATTGLGSSIAYAASKAAISNITKAMAVSQAPEIRVNEVAPGVVMTRWVEGWEQYTEPHREQTPLKRLATPDDVAKAIYSIAMNPFVTGQSLMVDGGRLLNV